MAALRSLIVATGVLVWACSPARAEKPPTPEGALVAVHIVSRVGDGGIPDDTAKRARRADGVLMFAVLDVASGTGRNARHSYYSDAPTIRLRGKKVATAPLSALRGTGDPVRLSWQRVEPRANTMSNTESGDFRFEAIDYTTTAIEGSTDLSTLTADVRPTLTPDHGDGVGTMRYQVVAILGGQRVASAGVEARRGRGSGGLTDAVHRVSLRRDDTYLGYLTEMYGQPYIWASAGTTNASHQSERLEGSDCADFVVYGARRMGLKVPYVWTGSLPEHARTLASGALADDGVYRDRRGRPLPFTAAGDLVLFPRHVGVLTADRGTIGVLDTADVMMHTLFDSPKEQRIADSGYADNAISILRWRR